MVAGLGSLAEQPDRPLYLCGRTSGYNGYAETHPLLSTTVLIYPVTGAVDTWKVCENGNTSGIYVDSDGEANETLSALAGGTLFSGDLAGSFAVLFSLFTNVIATLLIAYRSWCE